MQAIVRHWFRRITGCGAWRQRLRLLACCCLLAGEAPAQTEKYPFNFAWLSKDNGLPHNYCHTALRDRRGFLWFGTQDGLARYDGTAFKVYAYRGDSTGLSAPTVLDLEEDRQGKLWIATVGGGLNRFDPESETFTWFRHDPLNPATLPGNDLTNLLIDDDGSIWVGGYNSGLSHLDPASGRCQNFNLAENLTIEEDRYRRNSVQDIAADQENPDVLWLAANDGIFRFDKRSGQLKHFPSEVPCRDVQADIPGAVWVATEGGGIARFDKNTAGWAFYAPLKAEWARRNLSTNLIADISMKSAREFWVASLDLGFGIFDIPTKTYTFFNSQAKLLAGQTGQSVNGLYTDPAGLLWIFNFKNGVSLLDPASNVLAYTPLPGDGCRNPQVNEPQDFAWNAQRQELYVVTQGCRGLYVYKPVTRIEPVELSGQSPYALERSVAPEGSGHTAFFQCLLPARDGRFWVGGLAGGGPTLYEYHPDQNRLAPFNARQPGATALRQYSINALVEDAAGQIWAGTTKGGLFRIDVQSGRVQQIVGSPPFNGAQIQVTDLTVDRLGYIWLATEEAGVFRYDPKRQQFVQYAHRPGSRLGLAEDRVYSLAADAAGNIWVGMDSQGFQKIPAGAAPDAVFPQYTMRDGLAFNKVHRVETAPDGSVWLATEKGISVFQPGNLLKPFDTFDESDGLADTYLNRKGFRRCANGEIFVGQVKGFYAFRPAAIYQNRPPPKAAFTGFQLFGQPYFTGKDINFQQEIRLRHDQNFFTIQFAALNFSQANRNQYAYRLESLDPNWVPGGNRTEATYTHVPPGKYRFLVRVRTSGDTEFRDALSLAVVVEPAFYQTWWFRTLIFALFVGAAVWYFRNRLDLILKQEAAKSELSRLRAVKAELENKALRAQMNPHFIFNALNTIEALIVEEKPDAASALLQKFSKLVRLVLENSQHTRISLALELEALELYLQLEAIRLDGRFQYRLDIDPGLDQRRCLLPPLILQPFVENAILHGLRHLRDREGLLRVEVTPTDSGHETVENVKTTPAGEQQKSMEAPGDPNQGSEPGIPRFAPTGSGRYLRCRIEDNGIGRAQAAEINARNRISGKKQSLGTRLTHERVELLNAPGRQDYRVEITDLAAENGTGTVVTLTLPLELKSTTENED